MATIAASVGFALAAAVDTTWSSRRKSGGKPPAPACKTLKNTVIVSTASFGAFGWPWSSPVALARRNRRHAEEKGAPAAAARSCSHFSRFKYSRRAASAASSTANACGARSSTVVSALRSWHASSIRATHAPPRACASAIARTTHSRPAGPDVHTPCRTRAALGCPPASRNDLSVATATSARNPPALLASSAIAAARPSAITSSHPFARTAGITRVPLVAAASVGASAGGVASMIAASERYRSMLFQHWFALPKGAAPSSGGSFRREDGHGKRGDATAQQRRSSWPLGERRHAEPSHTASIGKGTLSIVARSNISIRASNESLFGHEKPSWSRCAIAALQSRRGAAAASASTAAVQIPRRQALRRGGRRAGARRRAQRSKRLGARRDVQRAPRARDRADELGELSLVHRAQALLAENLLEKLLRGGAPVPDLLDHAPGRAVVALDARVGVRLEMKEVHDGRARPGRDRAK